MKFDWTDSDPLVMSDIRELLYLIASALRDDPPLREFEGRRMTAVPSVDGDA